MGRSCISSWLSGWIHQICLAVEAVTGVQPYGGLVLRHTLSCSAIFALCLAAISLTSKSDQPRVAIEVYGDWGRCF